MYERGDGDVAESRETADRRRCAAGSRGAAVSGLEWTGRTSGARSVAFETACGPQPPREGERNFNPFASAPKNNKSGEKNLEDAGDSGWRPAAKAPGLLHLTEPSKMSRLSQSSVNPSLGRHTDGSQ